MGAVGGPWYVTDFDAIALWRDHNYRTGLARVTGDVQHTGFVLVLSS